MDSKELKTILGYNVEALRSNVERHRKNIATWSEAIQDAKREIKELESYILLIEESKIGHRVCSSK